MRGRHISFVVVPVGGWVGPIIGERVFGVNYMAVRLVPMLHVLGVGERAAAAAAVQAKQCTLTRLCVSLLPHGGCDGPVVHAQMCL